ncbi:unnamed protein product [Phaedon cochleariae]|uniref:Uncharacterized protein n=1 Tax=Phaedon cochleariae TaxID=80249 RepID=A0A9P0GRM6_PHACE|nr:unnamed protein product [Phaedon cochleariae]
MPRKEKLFEDFSQKLEYLYEEIMKMKQQSASSSSENEEEIDFVTPIPRKNSRKRIRAISSSSDEDISREVVTTALIHSPPQTMCADSLIGTDPTKSTTAGPPLDTELVVRWSNYLTEGIDKEARKEFQKIVFPENCPQLAAPSLNMEADKLMSSSDKKKDALLMSLQDKLGRGLTLLGEIISLLLSTNVPAEIRTLLTPKAALSSKQFCEVHYLLSNHRRYQMLPLFTQATQKVAQESKLDNELFGKHFDEKCKTNLTVEKSAIEIRAKKTKMETEARPLQPLRRGELTNRPRYRTYPSTYPPQRDHLSR